MNFLHLLQQLSFKKLRIHQLFPLVVFYYCFYCLIGQFPSVSCTPITIEQREISLPQGIKEIFNNNKKFQEQGAQKSLINAEFNDGEAPWETVLDPRLYVITELEQENDDMNPRIERENSQQIQQRDRRSHHSVGSGAGHSLSIVNPLDVLRQRLLLEIARRRMRQSNMQIIANAEILKNIG